MSLDLVDPKDVIKRPPKYGQRRTWSNLCGRFFDSKAEALRGEELCVRELAGDIWDLAYQPRWVLSEEKPRITYTADFTYLGPNEDGTAYPQFFEDVKGVLTRDARTRIAWVKQLHKAHIRVLMRVGNSFEEMP